MKVCVVTPSLNQGRFIRRTIESVRAQCVAGLDHLIIDGGSTDHTIDVLRNYGGALRWVSEPDNGQAHAVNKGIAGTCGEVIGWLNSDDVYYSGAISAAIDHFSRNPQVDVIYGQADHIDQDGNAYESYPTERWNFERLIETCFLCQPAVFFRRRVVERFGLLDESLRYCMDYEFWLRLGQGGAVFDYLPRKLAGSRMYPENKTLSSTVEVHREISRMLRKRIGSVPDTWLVGYAYAVTKRRRGEECDPTRFNREVSARSVIAAVIWNGWVRRSLLYRLFPRWLRR